MLYGNIIFYKKKGGDGSKYPVTEKSVKIGRTEECLIRIYNTQVALEHCQLIIGENGQATLKDLSNQTFLNGNKLDNEEATLCHGDIFKVGERLARWEYLPTSKYYRQFLSPTGRLVAVVMPQQRCSEGQLRGASACASVLKDTAVEGKRKFSERFTSENAPAVKIRKSENSSLGRNSKGDLLKLLTGRHSLKTKKLFIPMAKMNERKSTTGIINSNTPKRKSGKSLLPSRKVNTESSPSRNLSEEVLSVKSGKSFNGTAKNILRVALEQESQKLLNSKKTSQESGISEEIIKSASKNIKTSVKVLVDSALKIERSKNSRSSSKSPSSKRSSLILTPSEPAVLIQSEKKLKSSPTGRSAGHKDLKRLSAVLVKENKARENMKLLENLSHDDLSKFGNGKEIVSDEIVQSKPKCNKSSNGFLVKRGKRSIQMKTLERFSKTSNKSPQYKVLVRAESKAKSPRVSETQKRWEELAQKKLKTPSAVETAQVSLQELDEGTDSKKVPEVFNFQNKPITTKSTSLKKTPRKIEKNIGAVKSSSTRKSLSKSPFRGRNSVVSPAPAKSQKSSPMRISLRKTINLSKERISSRGAHRKLSPSISSAERAAKKLKTSSPKKPDKNKKAALLVLGKANRKQLLAQNVKILLKQKIVKKAIKQSTAIDSGKMDSIAAVKSKPKKKLHTRISKAKIKAKKKKDSREENTLANSSKSAEVPPQSKEQMEFTSKGEIALERDVLNGLKDTETSPRSPSKFKNLFNEASGKSLFNEYRNSESPLSISQSFAKEAYSPYTKFENAAENFLFNSNRRCSKRLSSKNDLGRPDFDELSPTALGLIPKNTEVFKTPKKNKRKSSSLVTPRNIQSIGIIKSASTSKIGNRKNVRFSSKDKSLYSKFCSPSEKTDFDLGSYQTPDLSVDVFISPLGDKTSDSRKGLNEYSRIVLASEDDSEPSLGYRNNSEPRKCIRKLLQSPQTRSNASFNQNELLQSSRSSKLKCSKGMDARMNSESNLSAFNLEVYTTAENNLSDMNGVTRDLRSPKNDSADVKRAKKLQKSPKNDLSDLRGVKKLLRTPKVQKSPKNDLSDLRGVKKLLRTPKVQKSPKNDLSDLRGVKKLLRTPKVQKSPKNDLSDLRGVKKLLRTPKVQKSPENNLTDIVGVKELFRSSRIQKGPKNELELLGVEELLGSPMPLESANTNPAVITKDGQLNGDRKINGEKQVLVGKGTSVPKNEKIVTLKSRVNDLGGYNHGRVVYPRTKGAKNDLSDLTGVRELFSRYTRESDFSETLTSVSQLFNLPEEKVEGKTKRYILRNKSKTDAVQNMEGSEEAEAKDEYIKTRATRRGLLRKEEEATEKPLRGKKSRTQELSERKLTERKPAESTKPSKALKPPTAMKRSERIKKETEKGGNTVLVRMKAEPRGSGEIKTRKRKNVEESAAGLPPKLPRKRSEESNMTTKKSKTGVVSTERNSAKNVRKASGKVRTETCKSSKGSNKASKISAKRIVKVQKKRSQSSAKKNISDSEEKLNSRKTRSAKSESMSRPNRIVKRGVTAGNKISTSRTERKKLIPLVKKSTKRK